MIHIISKAVIDKAAAEKSSIGAENYKRKQFFSAIYDTGKRILAHFPYHLTKEDSLFETYHNHLIVASKTDMDTLLRYVKRHLTKKHRCRLDEMINEMKLLSTNQLNKLSNADTYNNDSHNSDHHGLSVPLQGGTTYS